ncbi:hypothetical protein [Planktothricoides raciborskii]|uniref:Uncharacterized protein n=1 Tax=Planktothricoides raciborskii GIHE-MW2 TaxID=2792601 RepID=A0AAU8JKW7_9CYAN
MGEVESNQFEKESLSTVERFWIAGYGEKTKKFILDFILYLYIDEIREMQTNHFSIKV